MLFPVTHGVVYSTEILNPKPCVSQREGFGLKVYLSRTNYKCTEELTKPNLFGILFQQTGLIYSFAQTSCFYFYLLTILTYVWINSQLRYVVSSVGSNLLVLQLHQTPAMSVCTSSASRRDQDSFRTIDFFSCFTPAQWGQRSFKGLIWLHCGRKVRNLHGATEKPPIMRKRPNSVMHAAFLTRFETFILPFYSTNVWRTILCVRWFYDALKSKYEYVAFVYINNSGSKNNLMI